MGQTAIVLGAGGAAGWAFHAGAVGALTEMGRPLASAAITVATSAGAPVAASVLSGATSAEVASALLRQPTPDEIDAFRATLAEARSSWLRRLRPAAPGMVAGALARGAGAGVALAGLAPAGVFPTAPLRRAPGVEALGTSWPTGLWIPAVALTDGRRTVFGRDRVDVEVAAAVEASQAVPIMFSPREIDGTRHVDGATHSPTNADLLVGLDAPSDLTDVILVAPMTRHPSWPMRTFAVRRLRSELADLRAAGLVVRLVVPDDDTAAHLTGFPRRDAAAIPLVVEGGRRALHRALDGT